ncbi:MAG: hypothetical protein EA345_00135 [Halomonas sp.]|nr:hypothetical protein [Halomonas sp.]TVP53163.1 MAG: hypothetical protein EA345_00135 [Halomonas sp.]
MASLGLRVERIPNAERIRASLLQGTSGWNVEFVGPSGVGKTYLCRQVAPSLSRHWFFERHAKSLSGSVPEDPLKAQYFSLLYAARFVRLQNTDLGLARRAAIVARMSEVIRQGLVAHSLGLPRGFILDDGIAHFFAEQILAQDINTTATYLRDMGLIFLLPPRPDTIELEALAIDKSVSQALREAAIYWRLYDLATHCGAQILTLDATERRLNPQKVHHFFDTFFTPKRLL